MSFPPAPSPDNAVASSAAFCAPSLEQLTGLVFELASQLHVERVRRIALEAALEASGLLVSDAVESAAAQPQAKARASASFDRTMAGIMRVLTEDPDPRTPLRTRQAGDTSQADPA